MYFLVYSIAIFAIISVVAIGCKPISKVGINNIHVKTIKGSNFKELNGIYSNRFDTVAGKIIHYPYDAVNDTQRVSILSQLFLRFPETAWRDENGKMINPKEKWIKIEFQSKNKAIISMYNKDKFVFAKQIHVDPRTLVGDRRVGLCRQRILKAVPAGHRAAQHQPVEIGDQHGERLGNGGEGCGGDHQFRARIANDILRLGRGQL